MSSLFRCPGFTYFMVMVDVLHTLDLGVTQEVMGNVFFECLSSSLCAGRNRAAQASLLFQRIRDFYRTHWPTSQIANLMIEMLKQPGKPQRFRGKAAETKHLVPFAMLLANDLVAAHPGTHNETVKNAVRQLYRFYMTMGTSPFNQASAATSARRFCVCVCVCVCVCCIPRSGQRPSVQESIHSVSIRIFIFFSSLPNFKPTNPENRTIFRSIRTKISLGWSARWGIIAVVFCLRRTQLRLSSSDIAASLQIEQMFVGHFSDPHASLFAKCKRSRAAHVVIVASSW